MYIVAFGVPPMYIFMEKGKYGALVEKKKEIS